MTAAESAAVDQSIQGMRKTALIVSGIGAVGFLIFSFVDGLGHSLKSYLIGYMYALALGLGCMALNLLHNTTGGAWGFSIKRFLNAGQRTVPWLALLFLPIAIGSSWLYVWMDHDIVEHDHVLHHKAPWLNPLGWWVRAALYFGLWWWIASWIGKRWNAYESSNFDGWTGRQLRRICPGLIIVYGLAMTGAAVDWMMSLEPHWFSTIYGALAMVCQALTVFCFCLVLINWLCRKAPVFASHYASKQFHDISALKFAFIVLWTYMTFAQFLIIWSGNVPEETPWYLVRVGHGWSGVALLLLLFHFLVPFLLLLRLRWKKSAQFLYGLAAAMLVMRFIDLYWWIAPALPHGDYKARLESGEGFHPDFAFYPTAIFAVVALVSFWLWAFAGKLREAPLMVLENGELKKAFEEPPTP